MSTFEKILNEASHIAETVSLKSVTASRISGAINISRPSIFYHFSTIENLVDKVVQKAIDDKNVVILRQAIVQEHRLTKTIDTELRKVAIDSLM